MINVQAVASALTAQAKATTWPQEDLPVFLAPFPYQAAPTVVTPPSASTVSITPTSWATIVNAILAHHRLIYAGPARQT